MYYFALIYILHVQTGASMIYRRLCYCIFQGILLCDLYYVVCTNCSEKKYGGPKNHIHVWSKLKAAGHEIGWDFISNVRKLNGCSFSGFCDMMTHYYQSGVDPKCSFMSKTTFIKWFFSFLAAFQIDFRQEVSPILYDLLQKYIFWQIHLEFPLDTLHCVGGSVV